MFDSIKNFIADCKAGYVAMKTDVTDGYHIGKIAVQLDTKPDLTGKSIAYRIGYELGYFKAKHPNAFKWFGCFCLGTVLLCTMRVICPVLFTSAGIMPHLLLIGYVAFTLLCMYKIIR